MRVLRAFILILTVSSSVSAKEAGLYFDLGPASEYLLTSEVREEVIDLVNARLQALSVSLGQLSDLEKAADVRKHDLKDSNSRAVLWAGGFCGVIGAGLASIVATRLCGGMGSLYAAEIVGQALFAATGAMFGFSIGASWQQLQNAPPEPSEYKLILDRRGDEILKAAEDLVAQIRAMALPINLWSIRRFHDFVNRVHLLRTLELILLKDFQHIEEKMKAYLKTTSYALFLNGEVDDDLSDAELMAARTRILRSFRRMEWEGLKYIQEALPEIEIPNPHLNLNEGNFAACLHAFRALMKDE